MAGIGVKLNNIFEKHTIATSIYGMGYSAVVTITPMIIVLGNIMLMEKVLGFSSLVYMEKDIFSSTVLYVFVFALMATAPLNAVISKYISDVIFEEHFDDIMSCYYAGLLIDTVLAALMGVPFCVHAVLTGKLAASYMFAAFLAYMGLMFVFYTVSYLAICKYYEKIMLFYFVGMAAGFAVSLLLFYCVRMDILLSMLSALAVGFIITGALSLAVLRQYFKRCSHRYKRIFGYIAKYWKLVVANFTYTLGLYIHNFVFWTSDLRVVVADTFVYAGQYDLASCLAMFTNISATVIFIANVEMHFHSCYKEYSEAIIGGRYSDIEKCKNRMFRRLSNEIMSVTRIQFIISIVVYLLCVVILPEHGFNGLVMTIYPAMAAGYFIVFIMYSALIFLYYFDDLTGAMMTGIIYAAATFVGSMVSRELPEIWYGIGVFFGAIVAWGYAYHRLRWVEKNIDVHIFCRGDILKRKKTKRPSNVSYRKGANV